MVGSKIEAGRTGRTPQQWSSRNDSGVTEDGDHGEEGIASYVPFSWWVL